MRSRDDMISRAGRNQNPAPGFHWLEALTLGILGPLEIEVLQMPQFLPLFQVSSQAASAGSYLCQAVCTVGKT